MAITDDDMARSLRVRSRRWTITEGESGQSYTIVLDTEPAADVTVVVAGAGDNVDIAVDANGIDVHG